MVAYTGSVLQSQPGLLALPARTIKCAATAPAQGSASLRQASGADQAKRSLRSRIDGTLRGGAAETLQRGAIEEAQLELESFGMDVDYQQLAGTWRMIYTTALDVRPIVQLERFPFAPVTVGDIYQRFTGPEEGRVENIIKFSIPFLLEQGDGVTVKVGARYEVTGARRIALTFEEAGFGNVRISPILEALLAPALLPRGFLNHQLLLALKELQVRIPFMRQQRSRSSSRSSSSSSTMDRQRGAGQGQYLLTYLDDDMLVGRQQAGAGTFIFERTSRDSSPWVWR